MKILNKFYPHLTAFLGFVIVSLLYFYPVLQGKSLYQSDIAQYTGMAKEQNDFRATEKTEPFWTNNAFGGMPTYQMGANYPHNYIKKIDDLIRFLPRPADYLFLYFLSFYVLLIVLKTNPLKAFFGALAFGFSTYLIVILGVGHNAKAHAIGYMPAVVASVLLVFQRKYIVGGLLAVFAIALEISANHFQMTYYLLIVLIAIGIFYLYEAIKSKSVKQFSQSIGILIAAAILAIGANASNIMATAEYANFSIRGKSELTENADGTKNQTQSAMKKDYITEYSYGVSESLNLIAPRLFGGSNSEKLGEKSNVYEFISKQGAQPEEALTFTQDYGMTYWGDQPIVAAPAYIGIIVFFLAILGLFADHRKIKYAFLAGSIISLMLSWGKNFSVLTDFFIDFVPMYDKFRAVSSIQVILELCMPVLAIMGLQSFFKHENKVQFQYLWKTTAICLGIIVLLFVSKSMFSFAGGMDQEIVSMMNQQTQDKTFGLEFIRALKQDRQDLYNDDLLRSGIFLLVAAGALFMFNKNKLSQQLTIVFVGILMVTDLFLVSNSYFDKSNFVSKKEVETPFEPSSADSIILADKTNFRVFDVQGRLQSKASFFHKSVGGYSAVRPRRFEEIFEYIIDKKLPEIAKNINEKDGSLGSSTPILDALNIKYLLFSTKEGEYPLKNPFANGSAWFVSNLKKVNSADEEMKAISSLNLKESAVFCETESTKLIQNQQFTKDSLSKIKLDVYKSNYIKYTTSNKNKGLAVFSEMYYPKGWNVFVDGKPSTHFRVDYVLRAMEIPAGQHSIEFKFEPEVVKKGSTIALICSLIMLILLGTGVYFVVKKS